MKRTGSASLILAAALTLVGCSSGGEGREVSGDAAGGRLAAQVSFPVAATDLRIRANVEGDTELRRLTAVVAGVDGVAAGEANYSGRSVDVVLHEGLDGSTRAALVDRIATTPGVASVTPLR